MVVMADPANPITRLREAAGMTRRAFARHLGVAYTTLMNAELGYPLHIPPTLLMALTRAGYDTENLQGEYIAWHSSPQKA